MQVVTSTTTYTSHDNVCYVDKVQVWYTMAAKVIPNKYLNHAYIVCIQKSVPKCEHIHIIIRSLGHYTHIY